MMQVCPGSLTHEWSVTGQAGLVWGPAQLPGVAEVLLISEPARGSLSWEATFLIKSQLPQQQPTQLHVCPTEQSEACPPQPDAQVTQQWLRARCDDVSHASLPHLAGLADEYLFSSSRDETANGLAEKTGEERIERRLTVQEVVKKVEQSLVPSQPVTDLRHVARQQLTGCVWVPEGAQCKQLEVNETSPLLRKLLE